MGALLAMAPAPQRPHGSPRPVAPHRPAQPQGPHAPVDLNADLGEGFAFDAVLMPLLTSCNIACGGHYGDVATMRAAVALSREHGVAVGAHPSYPDRAHFGRVVPDLPMPALIEALVEQLDAFASVCASASVPVHHIKPHGALYHQASVDPATADAVMAALMGAAMSHSPRPALYLPEGSLLADRAQGHFEVHWEGFLDRRYRADGRLVSRTEPDAVITDPAEASAQFEGMVLRREIRTVEGATIRTSARTYCVHGDTPGAVEILKAVRAHMDALGLGAGLDLGPGARGSG
jgi:5-oxoprolinase (ATP-hydrolysing) subunit A